MDSLLAWRLLRNKLMYRSNQSLNIPPRAFEFLENPEPSCLNAPPRGKLPDYCFNFWVASIMLLKLCMLGTGQKVQVGGGPKHFQMWWLENTRPTPSNWSKTDWPTPKWRLKITWPTPYKTWHFWLINQKKKSHHILWMKLWCYLCFRFIFLTMIQNYAKILFFITLATLSHDCKLLTRPFTFHTRPQGM